MQPIEILKEDFAQTVGFIDKCDDHIFKIKNWALLTSSAVIAFSISQNHHVIALANLALLVAHPWMRFPKTTLISDERSHDGRAADNVHSRRP